METDEKALYLAAWHLIRPHWVFKICLRLLSPWLGVLFFPQKFMGEYIFSSWGDIPLISATLIVGGWYSTELPEYLKSARDCQVFRQGSATIYLMTYGAMGHSHKSKSTG